MARIKVVFYLPPMNEPTKSNFVRILREEKCINNSTFRLQCLVMTEMSGLFVVCRRTSFDLFGINLSSQ